MAARVGLAPTPCGLTNRRATLTPPGNGAAGRIPTCIVPFRRRMPHVFDHGSNLKLVSAAGLAPAIPRFQAEHVATTPRAGSPRWFEVIGTGETLGQNPGNRPRGEIRKWRTRRELHPQPSRRQRGALLIELRVRDGLPGRSPVENETRPRAAHFGAAAPKAFGVGGKCW